MKSDALTPTSVVLSWVSSDGDGHTNYSVSYVYMGPCSDLSSTGVAYTNTTQYTIEGLEEYSSYAVTIRAARGGQVTMENSTVITLAAGKSTYTNFNIIYKWFSVTILGPSGPATSVVEISKTNTEVTVGWGPVSCTMLNSVVRGYRVQYRTLNNGNLHQEECSDMKFTATELDPYTDYSFEVAAINVDGLVGPYSTPVIVKTLQRKSPRQWGSSYRTVQL